MAVISRSIIWISEFFRWLLLDESIIKIEDNKIESICIEVILLILFIKLNKLIYYRLVILISSKKNYLLSFIFRILNGGNVFNYRSNNSIMKDCKRKWNWVGIEWMLFYKFKVVKNDFSKNIILM